MLYLHGFMIIMNLFQNSNLQILADRVLVEPDEKQLVTPAGIIIPEGFVRDGTTGKVVACGPGSPHSPNMFVKKGDNIIFNHLADAWIPGSLLNLPKPKYLLLRITDVWAVVNDN